AFPIPALPDDSPILRRVDLLCDAANGDLGECRDDAVDESVSLALDDVWAALTSSALDYPPDLDDAFWAGAWGQLFTRVQLWLECDELITLSEAARLLRGEASDTALRHVNDLIARRKLTRYADPD